MTYLIALPGSGPAPSGYGDDGPPLAALIFAVGFGYGRDPRSHRPFQAGSTVTLLTLGPLISPGPVPH
jgi:hypothetical protein